MGWKKKAAEYRRQYYTLAENGHRQVKEEIVRTTITIMLLNQSLSGSVHRQRASRDTRSPTPHLQSRTPGFIQTTSSCLLQRRSTPVSTLLLDVQLFKIQALMASPGGSDTVIQISNELIIIYSPSRSLLRYYHLFSLPS